MVSVTCTEDEKNAILCLFEKLCGEDVRQVLDTPECDGGDCLGYLRKKIDWNVVDVPRGCQSDGNSHEYRVSIVKVLRKEVSAGAYSLAEAKKKIERRYLNGEIVMTSDDYLGVFLLGEGEGVSGDTLVPENHELG